MSKRAPGDKAQTGTPPAGEHPSCDVPVPPSTTAGHGPAVAAEPAPIPTPAAAPEPAPDYKGLYEQANDRWLRSRAELDNYRKRVQREFSEIRYQAILQTAGEFLGVYDHLNLALAHAQTTVEAASLRQGLELINAEFARVLGNLGVTRIETLGKPFDPACQEAISQEGSDDVPAGVVLREWKAGFALGGRLLRPAAVTVSSGPASAPAAADAPGGKRPGATPATTL